MRKHAAKQPTELKHGHVRVLYLNVSEVRPSPENDTLYHPVDGTDPEFEALVASVGGPDGVLEPVVVTADGWILSGHRRHAAAKRAGLTTIPCRTEPFNRSEGPDRFLRLLREFNRQRVKSRDERLREAVVDANPEEEYIALVKHRRAVRHPGLTPLVLTGVRRRDVISAAKQPFLRTVVRVIEGLRDYWPLSDRQIHYQVLNAPPLRHASKPRSAYANNKESYKDLTDLLTRARLAGLIPMEAIADSTRPVSVWEVSPEPGSFIRGELDGFLKGYWRDLMQGQPDHVEIVGEKNTVGPILRPIAAEYTIPMTIGRGYCSLPPRHAVAERFRRSGKRKLVLLVLTDFDPDGEEIAHSFARSLRDDFGIAEVHPVKVALNGEQVKRYALPPVMQAKVSSSHFSKFTTAHGYDVFELEALPPAALQQELRDAIDRVIDVAAFNAEVDAEKKDAAFLSAIRRQASHVLTGMDFKRLDAR